MEDGIKWVRRGSHRTAVLSAFQQGYPLTSTQIRLLALKLADSISARDVRRVLGEFRDRKHVLQINSAAKGNLFRLTESGRQLFSHVFGAPKPKRTPGDIDWDLYSFVIIGSIRKAALLQLCKLSNGKPNSAFTVAETRRSLKTDYPGISLSMASRAMREFKRYGLIESAGATRKGRSRQYVLSEMGRKIAEVLQG